MAAQRGTVGPPRVRQTAADIERKGSMLGSMLASVHGAARAIPRTIGIAAFAAFGLLPAGSVDAQTIAGHAARALTSQGEPLARRADALQRAPGAPTQFLAPKAALTRSYALPPPSAAERSQPLPPGLAGNRHAKPLHVGFGRDLAAYRSVVKLAELPWTRLPDGRMLTRFSLQSPGAVALRAEFAGTPSAALGALELRYAGSAWPARVEGPDAAAFWRGARQWSPVVFGDTMTVEAVLRPGVDPRALADLALGSVSHLFANPLALRDARADKVGEAGPCHRDIVCEPAGSLEARSAPAVARYLATVNGASGTCTATLVADRDPKTQLPYMLSASHCFSTQAVGDTVTTLWKEEVSTCGGATLRPEFRQIAGGVDLLVALPETNTDLMLMRLRTIAPDGAVWLGFDATPADRFPWAFTDIHHPAGDAKKISRGNVTGVDTWKGNDPTTHWKVSYTQGVTEPGSSGSALLFNRDGDQYRIRGVLSAGTSACNKPDGEDVFGRLDYSAPALDILSAENPPAAGAFTPQTGWWWDESKPGQGFGIEIFNGRLFVAGFLYDANGEPTWFVSNGALVNPTNYTGTMNVFTGGQTLDGDFKPVTAGASPGSFTVNFTSPTTAFLSWPGGTFNLKRYDIPGGPGFAAGPGAGMPERGWYWAPAEGGRGWMIEVQGDSMFMAGFLYAANGANIWYIATGKMTSSNTFQGTWQQVGGGTTYGGPFRPVTITNANVAAVQVDFNVEAKTAVLRLPGGRNVNLIRFRDF
jgi:hypothetical protein